MWVNRSIVLVLFLLLQLPGKVYPQDFNPSITYPDPDSAFIDSIRLRINSGAAFRWTDPDRATRYFIETEQASRKAGFEDGIGLSLSNLGVIAMDQGEYEQSHAYFTKAIRHSMHGKHFPGLASQLFLGIGNLYMNYGAYQHAGYYYFKALKSLPSDTMAVRISILNNIGGVYIRLEEEQSAMRYLNAGEAQARAQEDLLRLSFTLNNKGECLMQQGNYSEAENVLQEAYRNATLAGSRHIQQAILITLGNLYLLLKEPDKALRYLHQARTIINHREENLMQIQLNYLLGEAHYQRRDYERAEHYLLPALALATRLRLGDNMITAHATLVDLYTAKGAYQKALTHQKAWSQMKDSLLHRERGNALKRLEVRYQHIQKDKDFAERELLIARQKHELSKKNTLITIISLSSVLLIILMLLLLILYRNSRQKQGESLRRLEQEQEIMKREEDIKIMRALIEGEEKERSRIAQELHDGIGGMLAAIHMHMSAAMHRNGDTEDPHPERIVSLLEDTANEVRKTAHNLMPDVLARYSLEEAIQIYCNHITATGSISIDLQLHQQVRPLSFSVKLSLYRIIQELIQNIVKHAAASEAIIQINQQESVLSIMIEDNGRGFTEQETRPGIGFLNIRNRIRTLEGIMSVESSENEGTTVYLEFNIEKLEKSPAHEDDKGRYSG